jgi:hypothetical protein
MLDLGHVGVTDERTKLTLDPNSLASKTSKRRRLMPRIFSIGRIALTLALVGAFSPTARGQATILRVIGSDSLPVPLAYVTVQGGLGSITNERGQLSLGAGKHKTLTVEVRRIGYQPWFGKLEVQDTATVLTVVLQRLTQSLAAVTVTDTGGVRAAPNLRGFYDRWYMRQKGALSATFIGPEEIEMRHPSRVSDLLSGVLGISIKRTPGGSMVATNASGTCFMAIMVDGHTVCPPVGCHTTGVTSANAMQLGPQSMPGPGEPDPTAEQYTVDLNQAINPDALAAIEVYARGANMPISLQAADNACGVLAFWSGARR